MVSFLKNNCICTANNVICWNINHVYNYTIQIYTTLYNHQLSSHYIHRKENNYESQFHSVAHYSIDSEYDHNQSEQKGIIQQEYFLANNFQVTVMVI